MKGAPRNSVSMKYNTVYACSLCYAAYLHTCTGLTYLTCTRIVHTVRTPQAVTAHLGHPRATGVRSE